MKFKTLLVLLLAGIWGIGSWWWYTCQIKGFCGASTTDSHYADTDADAEHGEDDKPATDKASQEADPNVAQVDNDPIDTATRTTQTESTTNSDTSASVTEAKTAQDADTGSDTNSDTDAQLAMDTATDQTQDALIATDTDVGTDIDTDTQLATVAASDKDATINTDTPTAPDSAETETSDNNQDDQTDSVPAPLETVEPSTEPPEQAEKPTEAESEQAALDQAEADQDSKQDSVAQDETEQNRPARTAANASSSSDEPVTIEMMPQRSADGQLQGARLYFPFSASEAPMSNEAQAYFDQVIAYLQARPDARITLVGHTDSVGLRASNQKLGLKRANEVRDFMVQQGAAAQQIVAESKGESEPIADNRFTPGRQKNRRVELIPTTN